MAAPLDLVALTGQPVSRRRLRRMSRQFASVGVEMPAARLAQVAGGAPVSEDERVDIIFAQTADGIRRSQRRGARKRLRRRCAHGAVVAIAVVLALNLLLCLGFALLLLAQGGGA